jgi:hypothetical protein
MRIFLPCVHRCGAHRGPARSLVPAAFGLLLLCPLTWAQPQTNAEWLPFAPPDRFGPGSAIDLRHLNEAVAGENGRVSVANGQFTAGFLAQPIRFWAVNGPPADESPEALARTARLLARYGVNLVRLHGSLYDESGNLKADAIQSRIAAVNAMKRQGIYSHLSIYFPLWLTPKPGTPWLEGYDGKTHPFAAIYFSPAFQAQYQQWWKAVLLTPGPDGKRLLDEPALMSVELVNEDSLFFWTFNDKIPDFQLRIIEKAFGDWCADKYGSLDKTLSAWKGLRLKRDNPTEGRLAFRPLWNMAHDKTPRDADTAAFMAQIQRSFYAQQVAFLRKLGFKGLITCSNWTTADPELFGPIERWTYGPGDFIDRHGYFDSGLKGELSAWSIRNGYTYVDRSALRFDADDPVKPRVFSNPVMDVHYANLPSMISETTFCRPNRYRSEAPLYYAAYGSLQASDAMVHFALDGATWSVKPRFFMQPWTLMSPAMMGQFPAAALIYRRGLIEPGAPVASVALKTTDMLHLTGTLLPQDAALDELRVKDIPAGAAIKPAGRLDPLLHFVGRTDLWFTDSAAHANLADASKWIDKETRVVRSSTGELALDYGKGVLSINAPQAQGLSGNLASAGEVKLKDVAIRSDMELGHIMLVSLDEKPLDSSRRMLLQVMSEERPTGFQTKPLDGGRKQIVNIGKDPWLYRELGGQISFTHASAGSITVQPLDLNGYPVGDAIRENAVKLRPETVYYLIAR